jgi:acyl-CoA-binding protein
LFPRTSPGHECTKRIRETKRNELPSNRNSQDKPKEEKITWSVPDVSEYDALVAEWEGKKWRMLPKPGGAVVKPDDWYALHGLQKQVEEGNVKAEKPMWASHGGLDFDGRERWEKWNAAKGLSAEDAKLKFCQAYGKAMSDERNALNFRKY